MAGWLALYDDPRHVYIYGHIYNTIGGQGVGTYGLVKEECDNVSMQPFYQ